MLIFLLSLFICNANGKIFTYQPDWSSDFSLEPGGHRRNIYQLSPEDFKSTIRKGKIHTLIYPVSVSGIFVPYEPLKNLLASEHDNPLQEFIYNLAKKRMPFKSMDGLYDWLGLAPFPVVEGAGSGPYDIPYPDGVRPNYAMGAGIVETEWGKALTFSCASCHSGQLFGRSVMGLTNKRSRANHFFHLAKKYIPKVPSALFQHATQATNAERALFRRTKLNLASVGIKDPQVLGLDTSLAQVALSLVRRNEDSYATKNKWFERFPRENKLETFIADSKPAVWWNLKYKTRWLADGSIVSGNPVFTNFLWNELGRGTDLEELEKWMQDNQETIKELTSAVFASEAPLWTDFFPAESINLTMAKNGEKIFKKSCQKCHGEYRKQWAVENEAPGPYSTLELLKTIQVIYHEKTPVKNVGTDPQRFQGMKHFANELNELQISKWMKTLVVPQDGYVPPPLVGIWSRYPYLHNNSIPSLCALLTSPEKRIKVFYQGPAVDIKRDFDQDCVGYPTGDKTPRSWGLDSTGRFDTKFPGLRNIGHYKMLLDDQGEEIYGWLEKMDLIEFLKTL